MPRDNVKTKLGYLTLSGNLYEGTDWDAWVMRMENCLKAQDLFYGSLTSNHWGSDCSARLLDMELGTRGTIVTTLLLSNVSPSIADRISKEVRASPQQTVRQLRLMSMPFRLLDLPTELRTWICELSFPENRVSYLRESMPNIIQVSRQLRAELKPLFISTRRFVFPKNCYDANDAFKGLESWGIDILGIHVSSLRHLTLRHCTLLTWETRVLDMTYSKSDGFQITTPKPLKEACQKKLDEYAAQIEKKRKLLNLQGECIVLALWDRPQLFVEGSRVDWQFEWPPSGVNAD